MQILTAAFHSMQTNGKPPGNQPCLVVFCGSGRNGQHSK